MYISGTLEAMNIEFSMQIFFLFESERFEHLVHSPLLGIPVCNQTKGGSRIHQHFGLIICCLQSYWACTSMCN